MNFVVQVDFRHSRSSAPTYARTAATATLATILLPPNLPSTLLLLPSLPPLSTLFISTLSPPPTTRSYRRCRSVHRTETACKPLRTIAASTIYGCRRWTRKLLYVKCCQCCTKLTQLPPTRQLRPFHRQQVHHHCWCSLSKSRCGA